MYEGILYAVAWHASLLFLLFLLLLCTSSCSDPHEMNNNKKYKNCCNEHLEQGYYNYCLFPVETEMENRARAQRGKLQRGMERDDRGNGVEVEVGSGAAI